MKKNILNIFLGVLLTLMSGLLIWLITLYCTPIYFNTTYKFKVRSVDVHSYNYYNYTFYLDGSYKCDSRYMSYEGYSLEEDILKESRVGIYKIIGDRIYLRHIEAIKVEGVENVDEPVIGSYIKDDVELGVLKSSQGGKTLTGRLGYGSSQTSINATANFNKVALYMILVAIVDVGLIAAVFMVNRKCN